MVSSHGSNEIGHTGARFGGGGRHHTDASDGAGRKARFEVLLRGYDRSAVDAYVARQEQAAQTMRTALEEAEQRLAEATGRAGAAEAEVAELRRAAAERIPSGETGFGSRAEKLLRLAEREASEARSRAAAESSAIIDAARSAAEAHRHEVEQELIERVTRAEQSAAQMESELLEREQQMARKLEADRDESRRVHDAAARAAEVLRGAAEAEAEEIRLTARAEVEGVREEARRDLARLGGLRSDVRAELGRLVRIIETEVRIEPRAAGDQSRPAENVASVSALE